MRGAVKAFAEAGGVIYAECGGLLYLSQSLQPLGELPSAMGAARLPLVAELVCIRVKASSCTCMTQSCSAMLGRGTTGGRRAVAGMLSTGPACSVGVFPFRTHMTEKRMKMGYVAVETLTACSLFPGGQSARGHIYHFSEILEARMQHAVHAAHVLVPAGPAHTQPGCHCLGWPCMPPGHDPHS